jgi:hypothetical protein
VKGAIRNPQNYLAAALRRRTERFDECFDQGVTFGDVDSLVEIGGKFLLLEWKLIGDAGGTGQRRAFRCLAAHPDFTVVYIWTNRDGDIKAWCQVEKGKQLVERIATEESLKEAITDWCAWARSL